MNSGAIRHTFKAYERLKREQHIDTLFRNGKAYSVFPLRTVFLCLPRPSGEEAPARVGFSVPKKRFRKAVDRNRIKRLLREAWRLSKHLLYDQVPPHHQLHIFLIYVGPAIPRLTDLMDAIHKTIAHLSLQLPKHA